MREPRTQSFVEHYAIKKTRRSVNVALEQLSLRFTNWTGSSTAFGVALAAIILWALLGPMFHFSDTWQLTVNTGPQSSHF